MRLELEQRLLVQSKELMKIQVEQQALKDAYEVEGHKYIATAMFEEMKAKD